MLLPFPLRALFGVIFLLLAASVFSYAVDCHTPLLNKAPIIDGKIGQAEWLGAMGLDGFIAGDQLERRRVRAWIGADSTNIYVAIQSQLPAEGVLSTTVTADSLKAVYDDAVEVYVDPTPDTPDHVDYQFLVNALGKGGYNIHKTGAPNESEAWRGNWKQAVSRHDGWWDFECAIPVASMGMVTPGRKTTDGVWLINLTRDWKPDWGWTSFTGGYANSGIRVIFTTDAVPAVQFLALGDPTFPPAQLLLRLSNPSTKSLAVKAALKLVRNNMPELAQEQTVTLAPGVQQEVKLSLEANDPTTRYDLSAYVSSLDGTVVFYDRQTKWARAKEVLHWVVGKAKNVSPVDFEYAYYPSKNILRVIANITNLPKAAQITKVTAIIRDRSTGKIIKEITFPIVNFKGGMQEQRVTLPSLDGNYEIVLKALGKNVPVKTVVKYFERKHFPWENSPVGYSTTVYAPFTPITVAGTTLSTVLREHTLNNQGLLDQIIAKSANTDIAKPILAAPMHYTATVDGLLVPIIAQPVRVTTAKPNEAVVEGAFSAGALKSTYRDVWDYDGTVRVDLTLQPSNGKTINDLTLEIPFSDDSATLMHANSDRIRAPIIQQVPTGTGVIWDASKVACDDFIPNFCPYIYLGTAVRGLSWFAENDKNWGWNGKSPNLDVVRQGNQVILRIHLINMPTIIKEPRLISFGLLAAPVKPRMSQDDPQRWRQLARAGYSLLGTDINWLALGDCGSVYPAGQDMYIWEMLKRGNTTRLTDEEINQLIEHDKQYFEPYGKTVVDTFMAHARYNLTSRYGSKMVFYYNRASCQLFDEFETFKDEWCLDDMRSVGKGNSRGEIKVVPTDSYNDYNLYWYARSFETGNNAGVYWDNWFIAPTLNTEMTAAYKRADGTIVPATGIWAMRKLAKRTFVMMNERGMSLPFIWPHMTSFSPLPLLSFATAQLDWEWKYSEGDVQTRFSREYLQLVTSGDLAGVWPFVLSEHGPLVEDQWTQRTFQAVCNVHDIVYNVPEVIKSMLTQPGLTVYRYWEDRLLPVKAIDPDLPAIVYSVPGQEAVALITSYSRLDTQAEIDVDARVLGFPNGCTVINVDTNQPVTMVNGHLSLPLKKHDRLILRFTAVNN